MATATNLMMYDPVIYPQRLWIALSKDGKELNGLFRYKGSDERICFDGEDTENFEAMTFQASGVETDYYGALIVFTGKKYMTCGTIAHEAVHAAGYMFQNIRAEVNSREPFAFLVGWIADCCRRYKMI
jgi:hypothetical protein